MTPYSDEEWLKRLRSTQASAGSDNGGDTHALRNAIREWEQHGEPEHDAEVGLQQLLFRLRSEGLLEEAPSRQRPHRALLALAATVILSVGVVTLLVLPDRPDEMSMPPESVTRGAGGPAANVLPAADPGAAATEIKSILEGLDAAVFIDQDGTNVTLAARIPLARLAEARQALAPRKLSIGEDGQLEIRIVKK